MGDKNQPRHPAGSSKGGQWSDSGPGTLNTDVEQELLFARNTRLRILHVDPNGDFIDAEMVDD